MRPRTERATNLRRPGGHRSGRCPERRAGGRAEGWLRHVKVPEQLTVATLRTCPGRGLAGGRWPPGTPSTTTARHVRWTRRLVDRPRRPRRSVPPGTPKAPVRWLDAIGSDAPRRARASRCWWVAEMPDGPVFDHGSHCDAHIESHRSIPPPPRSGPRGSGSGGRMLRLRSRSHVPSRSLSPRSGGVARPRRSASRSPFR